MNILITGGASGLGEAITRKLALQHDNNVFFTFCSSRDNAFIIEKEFPNTHGIHCNFLNSSEIDSILKLFDSMRIDILVNNAYTTTISQDYFHKVDRSLFLKNFESNLLPIITISQKAISSFRKQKFGKIINILSSAIIGIPPKGWSEYTASKAYLASLSKSWADENARFNITSNSISPSFMMTAMNSGCDVRIVEDLKERNPNKKLLTIQEVADSVFFLTNCSQQINGTNLIMNSGADII